MSGMRTRRALVLSCVTAFWAATSFAQTFPGWMQETFENLDFAQGKIGETPPGWHLGPEHTQVFTAQIVTGSSCNGGAQCAEVKYIGIGMAMCFLYQNFKAEPYREKLVRFRAAVRADVPAGSFANLLVRVHKLDNSTSFYNDMSNRPITSKDWTFYEIVGLVDKEARDIEFGLQLHGKGSAWIDRVTLNFYAAQ
jgi:hypothetical protein